MRTAAWLSLKWLLCAASNVMGSDPDLGAILMKSFIFSLTKQDVLPREMIFYNEGVKSQRQRVKL